MSVVKINIEGVSDQVEFRLIEEFPGYAVGSDGTVLSCLCHGKRFSQRTGPWRFMKLMNSSNGYKQVLLTNRDGVPKFCRIHVLVLTAFVGERPSGMVACHFPDSDRTNNHVSNLRWDTLRANMKDRAIHGTNPVGVKNPMAKVNESIVRKIREESLTSGKCYREIAEEFSVSKSLVYQIVKRRIWTHV